MRTKVLSSRRCAVLLALCVGCSGPRRAMDRSADPGEPELDASEQPEEEGAEPDAAEDKSEQEASDAGAGHGGDDGSTADGTRADATASSSKAGLDAHVVGPDASEAATDSSSALDGGASSDAASEPEAGTCETAVRTVGRTIPDFMIVLDRSASMRTTLDPSISCVGIDSITASLTGPIECLTANCMDAAWSSSTACGGTGPTPGVDRWAPAVSAIKSLTSMFETRVSFGLITFPAGTGPVSTTGSSSNTSCAPGAVRVPLGANTAGAIALALDATQPAGYTPTSATLQSVLEGIRTRKAASANLPPQFVLLVTDGAPNCIGQSLDNDSPAHAATLQVLDALAQENVKTFVIGYDATVDARLAMQLAEYAQHGGTMNFYPVQDASDLAHEIVEITDAVVDCTFVLDQAPGDTIHVRVELDEQTLRADADGFSLQDKTLSLRGAACMKLREATPHRLSVTFECGAP